MSKLTLEDAISHCLEVAEQNETQADKWQEEGGEQWGKTTACRECATDHRQLAEWLTELKDLRAEQDEQYVFIHELMSELEKAKRLLKLATDTINHNLHKSCCNCSHFTSDRNCNIGKYLYGTGEKECEWEWKHMGEIINFLHD